MTIFDRRNRQDLDQLVEEFATTSMPRRAFMKRALGAGLSISAASALLAACGGGSTPNGSTKVSTIDILTEWSGEELASFKAITDAFTKKTSNGIKVNIESTRDLPAVLSTRVRGNNPPDVCGMPSLSTFQQLAHQKKLIALDSYFDMADFKSQYNQTWIDLSSVDGHLYAVLPKANSKGTIWYNPTTFKAVGGTIPTTWDELISVSDKIAGQGKYPWAMGVESAASSGWPAADWVDQIFLSQNGPDLYNQWVAHKIPWTHSSVKAAFQAFGQIANGKHYINGAPQSILATNFQDASYQPFAPNPKSYMYYLGDFTQGFITTQYKTLKAGTDYDFFEFPTINPQYKGAVTGGADLVVAMKDNDGTRQFMKFLYSAEAQSIWVKRGGATSANKNVDPSLYPDDIARKAAKQLTSASFFSVGADDLMPAAVENAYWKGLLTYIGDPKQLDSVLSGIEGTAQQSYTA
ncbi:ABC transporter substrate-binding protein [Dictyobacter arantiisoli]|uniref:ABC transporter substrate-binding protein n=1 Tax=Dictyobacter arantiisoli TaxID=2014874 RepID=A0A5A5TDB1_9CHLR|nr:ABC transporter substrate-binding protein [Dictyobacter arantiisoli]GCF09521.1 ABC transporter substrate-binding protein [Dictyobacter arantiisoli]